MAQCFNIRCFISRQYKLTFRGGDTLLALASLVFSLTANQEQEAGLQTAISQTSE